MEGRKHLTLADVETVMLDFAGELSGPEKASIGFNGSGQDLAHMGEGFDVDVALPIAQLDPRVGAAMMQRLGDMDFQNIDGRLQRLELSLGRLERLGVQSVKTLQALVTALTRPRDDSAS